MTPSPENRKIFEAARDHLHDAGLKNSEQFDKAILSLSSAGLALSISFSKFIVPIQQAEGVCLLRLSWFLFAVAICSTVISFITTGEAINLARDHIYRYYIEADQEYGDAKNSWGLASRYLNLISGFFFLAAIGTTVMYVTLNTNSHQTAVQASDEIVKKGYVPPKPQPADKPGNAGESGTGKNSNDKKK